MAIDKITLDVAGTVGYLMTIYGQHLLTRKEGLGWPLRVAGDLLWAGIGFMMGYWSVVVFSIVFALIDARGWVKWRGEQ